MKIVLLGYMGSGKSTIGTLLGQHLNHKSIDLDAYIVGSEGMPIARIFQERGEIYFRKKESAYLTQVLKEEEDIILSLGGGTPCYGNNMEHVLSLTENVIYLKVSVLELSHRLQKEKSERPLIKDISESDLPEFIGKHLFERSAFYQKANFTVDCDAKAPEVIVSEIEDILV